MAGDADLFSPCSAAIGEHGVEMPREIDVLRLSRETFSRLRSIPLADQFLRIEHVNREFEEHRARDTGLCDCEGLLQRRADVSDLTDALRPLHMGLHERHLVDVLQRALSLQHCRGAAAEQHKRRLGELRVLDCGHRVGEPRTSGDHCDPGDPAQPRDRIGSVDRGRLVANVHHADAALLCAHENR